ncbi:MAG: recombinase family protein, partial [Oscillospiraceae bacterium]
MKELIRKVYGYIRVSTETQADKGYGLETQRIAIEDYCNSNNLELVEIFKDEGITGVLGDKENLTDRQGVTHLLAKLDFINTIIVMNTSRLWRDDSARVLIGRQIRKANGNIISVEQPRYSLYSKDPQDFMFNSMMEMLDQYDRMCITQKLAKGRITKAMNGLKPCGVAPFGYRWNKNANIEIEPEEAEIILKIYELNGKGKGQVEIANYLNLNYPESKRKNESKNCQWTK